MPYPWPASAISEEEMALLHTAREASTRRVPITKLIQRAIIDAYGKAEVSNSDNCRPVSAMKEAA